MRKLKHRDYTADGTGIIVEKHDWECLVRVAKAADSFLRFSATREKSPDDLVKALRLLNKRAKPIPDDHDMLTCGCVVEAPTKEVVACCHTHES